MIEKGKNLQFYKWTYKGKEIQVVGERGDGEPMSYNFFFDKKKLENQNDLMKVFAEELLTFNKLKQSNGKINQIQ